MGLFRKFGRNAVPGRKLSEIEVFNQGSIAVVLIDMQDEYVCKLRNGESKRIIPNQVTVLKYCNKMNIPVIVLEYRGCGNTLTGLMKEARKNRKFKLFIKDYNSGFRMPELNEYLQELGVKKIFFMGINADWCVKDTAEDALKYGYEIMTSNEVISGQDHHRRDNNVPWFVNNGCYLHSVSALATVLEHDRS
ncbi:cysteine hydrolase [Candidatus Falkowbacteria bacterium]|nr:cysteine hydrolase [Candidatus Falkowbacteria bacterium]